VILEFEKWLEIGNVTRIKQEAFNSGVALVRSRRFYDKQRTLSADRAETLRAYNEKMALVRKDQAAQKRIDDKKIAEQKAIDDAARKAREDALKVELEKLAKKKGIEAAEKARAKAAAGERTRAAEEERKLKEQEEAAKKAREEKMDPALKELTRLNEVIQSLTTRQEKLYLQIVVHVEIVEAATAERKRAEEKEKAAIGYLNQLRKEQDACVKELLHTAGLMKKIKGGN
jgi:translation initiation factor IF-2